MMDEMFASRILDYKSRVLRVFLDFLVGEEKRIIEREKGNGMFSTSFEQFQDLLTEFLSQKRQGNILRWI